MDTGLGVELGERGAVTHSHKGGGKRGSDTPTQREEGGAVTNPHRGREGH